MARYTGPKCRYCRAERAKLFLKGSRCLSAKCPMNGDNLIGLLERRLDNVVFRMHFACSRPQAAQLVSHGHVFVNGKRVDIPSYRLKAGDEIEIAPQSKKLVMIKENLVEVSKSGVSPWLTVDADNMKGQFVAVPRKEEVKELEGVNEQLVVELYSR